MLKKNKHNSIILIRLGYVIKCFSTRAPFRRGRKWNTYKIIGEVYEFLEFEGRRSNYWVKDGRIIDSEIGQEK